MNVGDIRLRLFDRLGYASSPDSAVVRRMTGFIDEVHREILGKRGMAVLRRKILTCTSVFLVNRTFVVLVRAHLVRVTLPASKASSPKWMTTELATTTAVMVASFVASPPPKVTETYWML